MYFTGYWKASAQAEQEILETQKGMIHACEEETSLVLALDDSLVDPIYKESKGNPGHGSPMLDEGCLLYTSTPAASRRSCPAWSPHG